MERINFIALLIVVMVIFTACGGKENNSNNPSTGVEDNGKETEQEEKEGDFSEVATVDLETPFVPMSFSIDEAGEILMWKEQGDQQDSSYENKVWIDGDVQDIEIDKYGNTALLPSGLIVTAHVDLDAPEDKKHTIIEYNPVTGNEKTYLIEADIETSLLHPGFGTYLDESKTYVHTVTSPEQGEESFILNAESNEITNITIVEDIIEEVDGEELASFPHFFLSEDASKIYASVLNLGAFVYDVDTKELTTLVLDDDFVEGSGNTTMLTADGSHFAYAINDSVGDVTFHAVNVETKETIEIGQGLRLFMLTDGNIMLVDGNDVNKFDMETKELTTIHTIAEEDNQEVNRITVSPGGHTIAYSYTEKEEDEKKEYIKILSDK